jgi:hypothetical protein
MRKQIRSDLLENVYVENKKGTKFYKEYATSEWVYIPENFQELKELVFYRLQELNAQLFDTGITNNKDEIWVRGICFSKDNTISVRIKDNVIRVIMVGVDYALMWENIKSILNNL